MAPHSPTGLPAPLHRPASGDLAALPVDALLAEHRALLARLKLCFGADRAGFERELLPLVRAYAGYVHLLPATTDQHFARPGGLLQLGLETAFFALQGTDAHIFSGGASIAERVELEPRWRKATFIAGLCCELHRAIGHMTVTSPDGAPWPACLGPLAGWAAQQQVSHYRVRWRTGAQNLREARGLSLFALPYVVPGAVLQDLHHGNAPVVPLMLASIGGVAPVQERNVLDDLVRRALALVVDRDLLTHAKQFHAPTQGLHLQRLLIDAMRRLAVGHAAWQPNREKSRVWYGPEGLFLVWPGAAEDMLELLEDEQLAGIPRSTDLLRETLMAVGACVAQGDGQASWQIQPPGAKAPVEALRLASPAWLLAGRDPELPPLQQTLLVTKVRAPAMATPSARADAPATPAPAPTPSPSPSPAQGASDAAPNATPKAATLPDPQRSLLDGITDAGSDTNAPPVSEAAPTPQPPTQPAARLKAPLRLDMSVRTALAATLAALEDNTAETQACPVPAGLFVALAEFQRLGVQPAFALRALRDARMLVGAGPDGTPQVAHPLRGVPTPGVVIAAAHIDGLAALAPRLC
jgi:conjugal transfer pilus assembly protein TraI